LFIYLPTFFKHQNGGPDVSQITLTRFFALHVVILPLIAILFLILHFAMIRRQGISDPL
jgi:quinol-cytochrome oxidoreductase complex cytochrome b subunit